MIDYRKATREGIKTELWYARQEREQAERVLAHAQQYEQRMIDTLRAMDEEEDK